MADDGELRDAALLLWQEAQRQLTRQEADLDGLRNRAVAMLSVAALVAGFFGSHLASGHHPRYVTGAIVGALVMFGLTVLLSLRILAPRKNAWSFAHYLRAWQERLDDGTLTPLTLTSNLSRHFEQYRLDNHPKIEGLYRTFFWVCVLVGLQVIAWGITIF